MVIASPNPNHSPAPGSFFSFNCVRCPGCLGESALDITKRELKSSNRVRCSSCKCEFTFQTGFLSPEPIAKVPVRKHEKLVAKTMDEEEQEEATRAVELCDEILEKLSELPSRADDFAGSVGPKVESIRDWIEENQRVTPKQLESLENMSAGVDRWLEHS